MCVIECVMRQTILTLTTHTHTRTLRQSLITVNLRAPLSQPLAQKQQESANVVGMLFEGLGYVLGFGD